MSEAIAILQEVGNPKQLWEAHASLGRALDQAGRSSEGGEHWGAAATTIQGVAKGLSDRELRESFLNADPVREILARAER